MTTAFDSDSLPVEECMDLLRSCGVGRLAVVSDGEPDIFPVNYVMDGTDVVFRTAAGTKLRSLWRTARVAFEIDGTDPSHRSGWSVVVRGRPDEVLHAAERDRLEHLGLRAWEAGAKENWIVLHPDEVTGRRVGPQRG